MRFFIPFLLTLIALLSFAFALPKEHKDELSATERVDPILLQQFKLMSQYAAATYCFGNNDSADTPIICPQHNCPLVESANATSVYEFQNSRFTDTTGFIAVDDTNGLIVLAFRGSSEWKNWVSDLQTTMVPFAFGANLAQVHMGFLEAWKESEDGIVSSLAKAVKQYEDYQVVITGHSLGGAVATLAAVDIRKNVSAELYTFGAPKVGNSPFADLVEASPAKSYRITNIGDPVTRLPAMGYDHFQPEYHIFKGHGKEPGLDVGPDDIKIVASSSNFAPWFTEKPNFKQHTRYFGQISACASDPEKVGKQAEEVAPKEKSERGLVHKIRSAESIWKLQSLEEALQSSQPKPES
ncbi:MAG: hypothetical protein M1836_002889 [Candelina mexicana]|nr:MAG: hypothetical protein M1836_002889 [Candelina mexicana]